MLGLVWFQVIAWWREEAESLSSVHEHILGRTWVPSSVRSRICQSFLWDISQHQLSVERKKNLQMILNLFCTTPPPMYHTSGLKDRGTFDSYRMLCISWTYTLRFTFPLASGRSCRFGRFFVFIFFLRIFFNCNGLLSSFSHGLDRYVSCLILLKKCIPHEQLLSNTKWRYIFWVYCSCGLSLYMF